MVSSSTLNIRIAKTHQEQLKHVEKGCLTRTNQDVRSDGSRIEASHKGWAAIMHGMPSGIAVTVALAHDFVHRRNCRIDINSKKPREFAKSSHGSHHTLLANHTAHLWNALVEKEKTVRLRPLPVLREVNSGETFGLVQSKQPTSFKGLLELKEEEKDGVNVELTEFDRQVDPEDIGRMMNELNIDPVLLEQPAMRRSLPTQPTEPTLPNTVSSANLPVPELNSKLGKGKRKAEDLVDLSQEKDDEAIEVVDSGAVKRAKVGRFALECVRSLTTNEKTLDRSIQRKQLQHSALLQGQKVRKCQDPTHPQRCL